MVSSIESMLGRVPTYENPLAGFGDMMRQSRITDSALQTQELQRQGMQQQMGQQQRQLSDQQALGAVRYINGLGKQLLSVSESQWPQILQPNMPQLQQLGYTPDILQNMTREQVMSVVQQTEPLMGQPQGKKYTQGSGEMSGLVFDEQTGTYKEDPVAKRMLEQKALAERMKALEGDGKVDAKTRAAINKDVTSLLKDTVGIRDSAASLDDLKKNSSPAAKLAAVFKFMKALDPTSVVRETEQGQVYSAQGAAANIAGMLNNLIGGGRLQEEGFDDVVNTSKVLANSAINSTQSQVESYLDTFSDTLPEDFKSSLKERIPKSFKAPSLNDEEYLALKKRILGG